MPDLPPPPPGADPPAVDAAAVARWVEGYERAWRTAGTDLLDALFTADASYRMGPYEEPHVGIGAIRALWDAERTGPDEVFTLTWAPVAASGDTAVVRVEVRYVRPGPHEFRDLWIVRFAADGRCHSFEEWPFWPDRGHGPA